MFETDLVAPKRLTDTLLNFEETSSFVALDLVSSYKLLWPLTRSEKSYLLGVTAAFF